MELDDEGYLKDPKAWSEQAAEQIAHMQFEINLTETHWVLVRFFREYYARWGTLPTMTAAKETTGMRVEDIDALFRRPGKSPRGVICKIAGLPKLLCLAGC